SPHVITSGRLPHQLPSILYPLSSILYPLSSILYPLSSLPLHVITQQDVMIANEQLSIRNHRLRPRVVPTSGRLIEPPRLLPSIRRRFDQRDRPRPTLSAAIQTPIGVRD